MKKFISILLSVLLAFSVVSLSACDLISGEKEQPGHEHEYLKYLSDKNTHTGVCSCSATT